MLLSSTANSHPNEDLVCLCRPFTSSFACHFVCPSPSFLVFSLASFLVVPLPCRWKNLREWDRRVNFRDYPRLHYPQLFLLMGGYRNFHAIAPVLLLSFASKTVHCSDFRVSSKDGEPYFCLRVCICMSVCARAPLSRSCASLMVATSACLTELSRKSARISTGGTISLYRSGLIASNRRLEHRCSRMNFRSFFFEKNYSLLLFPCPPLLPPERPLVGVSYMSGGFGFLVHVALVVRAL